MFQSRMPWFPLCPVIVYHRSMLVRVSFPICHLDFSLTWLPPFSRASPKHPPRINSSLKRFNSCDRKRELASLYVPLQLTFRSLILLKPSEYLGGSWAILDVCSIVRAQRLFSLFCHGSREKPQGNRSRRTCRHSEANNRRYFVVNRPSNVRSRSMGKCINGDAVYRPTQLAYCAVSANVDRKDRPVELSLLGKKKTL